MSRLYTVTVDRIIATGKLSITAETMDEAEQKALYEVTSGNTKLNHSPGFHVTAELQGKIMPSGKTDSFVANFMAVLGDYVSASAAHGQNNVEAEQDITEYLLTGKTSQLEHTSILKDHLDELKKPDNKEDRVGVVLEILNTLGLTGCSKLGYR